MMIFRRRPVAAAPTAEVGTLLRSRHRYRQQIERLHEKHVLTRRMYTLQQGGVPLASMVRNSSALARVLAASVADGSYRSAPAIATDVVADGRERRVFFYRLTDVVVHGVIADVLQEAMQPRLSPRVFSYRRGVSRWNAIAEFAAYLRSLRRSQPDSRTRGVYVLRRDVDAYADSIPMGSASRIWDMVRETLQPDGGAAIAPEIWTLIERAVRPEYFANGRRGHASLLAGVATGQPIASVLFNLYLGDVDSLLEQIPGGFYGRYSDDIVFAHPDHSTARAAAQAVTQAIATLGLRFKAEKVRDLYLTRPGRPSSTWPDSRGAPCVDFLGVRVSAGGAVSLKPPKVRALLRELDERAATAIAAVNSADLERRGRVVCGVINRLLEPDPGRHACSETAALLRHVVTDREQLAQLDYRVARLALRLITGDSTVRAFRRLPYRRLREDWGLRSLLHTRNRWSAEPH